MTQGARKLLQDFDALSDLDQSEIVTELIRRVAMTHHDAPTDEDLLSAADQVLAELVWLVDAASETFSGVFGRSQTSRLAIGGAR